MVQPTHYWIVIYKNSKRSKERFLCLCLNLLILWVSISNSLSCRSAAPQGRNGPGQRQLFDSSETSFQQCIDLARPESERRSLWMAFEFAAARVPRLLLTWALLSLTLSLLSPTDLRNVCPEKQSSCRMCRTNS